MTQTVTIELGDGSTVEAEVIGDLPFQHTEEADGYGDVGVGRRAAQLGSAVALTLDQVRSTVRGIGQWAAETITEGGAAGAPDAFEVEFGLKLAVKSGQLLGVIAEAGSEAGLTVRLSWDLARRRTAAPGAPDQAGAGRAPAPPVGGEGGAAAAAGAAAGPARGDGAGTAGGAAPGQGAGAPSGGETGRQAAGGGVGFAG